MTITVRLSISVEIENGERKSMLGKGCWVKYGYTKTADFNPISILLGNS